MKKKKFHDRICQHRGDRGERALYAQGVATITGLAIDFFCASIGSALTSTTMDQEIQIWAIVHSDRKGFI